MTANLLAVVSGLMVVALSAAAAVTADPGGKMTICHMPEGEASGARTLQVSRSAWSAHERHGDHEGACTEADRKARPPASPPPTPPPAKTPLGLSRVDGDGELDGDATFKVAILNHGSDAGLAVGVTGTLTGDGDWRVHSEVVGCRLDGRQLTCDLGDLPAGASIALRFEHDGPFDVCREVGIDLTLTASNDASGGDDRAKESVRVGACSPLDPSSATF